MTQPQVNVLAIIREQLDRNESRVRAGQLPNFAALTHTSRAIRDLENHGVNVQPELKRATRLIVGRFDELLPERPAYVPMLTRVARALRMVRVA